MVDEDWHPDLEALTHDTILGPKCVKWGIKKVKYLPTTN